MRDSILGLTNPLIALLIAGVFFVIWSKDKDRRHVLGFSLAYASVGLGFLISQLLPVSFGRASVHLSTVPYYIGGSLMTWAVATRVNRPAPVRALAVFGAIAGVMLVLGLFFGDFTTSDLYLSNTLHALVFMMGAQATASTRHHSLPNAMIFWMLALTSLQFFVRPSLTFMIDGALVHETYRDSTYYSMLNATVALISVGLAMVLIAACVADHVGREKRAIQSDPLTGLPARRAFEEQVEATMLRAEDEGVPLSMVVGDIDHFKKVNDIWGHQAGDAAIAEFGRLIARTIRDGDIAGRIGGEEFCILVWNCNELGAVGLAERLRKRTAEIKLDGDTALDIRISASFGVSELVPGESYRSHFGRTDAALYRAKENGRNQVIAASGELISPDETRRDLANQAA